MVEDTEVACKATQHRNVLRQVARHDLRVLLEGGLPIHLGNERADVVGDEAIHCRLGVRSRCIPRRRHVATHLAPVVIIKGVEQLHIGMEVLLAGVRIRRVHVSGGVIPHDTAAVRGLVLGPCRDGIREILADDTFEDLAVCRAVEVAEHVVERAVLEQDQDDVVHGMCVGVIGHDFPFADH